MLSSFIYRGTSIRRISASAFNRLPHTMPTISLLNENKKPSAFSSISILPMNITTMTTANKLKIPTKTTTIPSSSFEYKNNQINEINEMNEISWFIKQAHSKMQQYPLTSNPKPEYFSNVEHFDLKMKLLKKHNSLWRHVILSLDMSNKWLTTLSSGTEFEKNENEEHVSYHLKQALNDISCISFNSIENENDIELLCLKYQIAYYMLEKNYFVFYCPDVVIRQKMISSINIMQEEKEEVDQQQQQSLLLNENLNNINQTFEPSLESASVLYEMIKQVRYNDKNINYDNSNIKNIKTYPLNDEKIIQQILNETSLFIPTLSKPLTHEKLLDIFLQSNKIQSTLDDIEPYYLINLGDIIRQHIQWCELLPRVKPFYAIKCNPNPIIIQLLHLLGCGFDCASVPEFQLLFQNKLLPKYKFDNNEDKDYTLYDHKLIYSNPCKDPMHLQYANNNGIRLMTFDSEYELEKIKLYHPFAKVLIRIQADDSHSICQFNSKFGVNDNMIESLFEKCKKLELNLGGIMFHVGSGCMKASVYKDVIGKARYYMDIAQNKYGFNDCNILDLGGGYPGIDDINLILFSDISKQINQGLNEYFYNDIKFISSNPKFQCIAEPGRYYVAKSHNLICSVIGKKKNKDIYSYTINDGIYGSFNCIIFDHQLPTILPLNNDNNNNSNLFSSTVFGPTCDSMDRLVENIQLPELNIGNKVIIPNFGAYTNAAATTFNGFPKSKLFYVLTRK